jgi:hypothetical protein
MKNTESEDEKKLNKMGWIIRNHSPLEIRHTDGSLATGAAALIVKETVLDDYEDEFGMEEGHPWD